MEVPATLFLEPGTRLMVDSDSRMHEAVLEQSPRGFLAWLVSNGGSGRLRIDDEGIEWSPGALARFCALSGFVVGWSTVLSARITPAIRPNLWFFTTETTDGRLEFGLSDRDGQRLADSLGDYLELVEQEPPRWRGPLKPA